jgi:hypothetical protein
MMSKAAVLPFKIARRVHADVNANGSINAGDVAILKSNLGTGLPERL